MYIYLHFIMSQFEVLDTVYKSRYLPNLHFIMSQFEVTTASTEPTWPTAFTFHYESIRSSDKQHDTSIEAQYLHFIMSQFEVFSSCFVISKTSLFTFHYESIRSMLFLNSFIVRFFIYISL